MTDITYAGYRPGALGRICELQSAYYGREWGFGVAFESVVAGDMARFFARYDPDRGFFLTALAGDSIEGGITIVGPDPDSWAQLRWFVVSDGVRGTGVGRELMARAMAFVEDKGYGRVYLTTIDGLEAARKLYERAGFKLASSETGTTWGPPVTEQRFEFHR